MQNQAANGSDASRHSFPFRMPAEWEPQRAVWFSWPHNPETWPDEVLRIAEPNYAFFLADLSWYQRVCINARKEALHTHIVEILKKFNANFSNIELYDHPTNDSWCRDHGPIFVYNNYGEKIILDWEYNAWGSKYPPYDLDNAIPSKISHAIGIPKITPGMILEGGSIEVDGRGTLITTKSCLLNPNRNPQLTQTEIEDNLKKYLGVHRIFWLEDGIVGDDTDGHVDDITRFVNPETVITVVEQDPSDANFHILQENLSLLKTWKTLHGKPYNIIELPMPAPLYYKGVRLPASYANFLITNEVVYVPIFGDDNDAKAIEILAQCFPGRMIKGIMCREIVWGLGTLHCLSQQEPL